MSLTRNASILASLAISCVSVTGQVRPYIESRDQKVTRVVWPGHTLANHELSIAYGQPKWRESHESFVDSEVVRHVRLGSGPWTTLQTNIEVILKGERIRVGRWYLGLMHEKK